MQDQNKKISLALSGGGHRATIFALGALLYLVDSGRNRHIDTISSVSGGSLTNAFLALLPHYCGGKSFREVDSSRFDSAAAALAHQIAGSPRWWWTAVVVYLAIIASWVAATTYRFPVSIYSWELQLPFIFAIVAWAVIIGPRSGGTFWAVWLTWLYTGLSIFFFALGIAILLNSSTSIVGWILVFSAPLAFGWRAKISELVMGKTICSPKRRWFDSQLLAEIPEGVRHIFCATDLHTGRHAYFSHDLIYSPALGLGVTDHFPLKTAVQASANFPIAFPPIRVRSHKFDFRLPNYTSAYGQSHVVFADGGIRDNMGVTWYLEAKDRHKELVDYLAFFDKSSLFTIADEAQTRLRKQLKVIGMVPDELIVINSSAPFFWKNPSNMWLPVIGDISSLLALPRFLYNNEGIRQARELREKFFSRDGMRGAIASIEEDPVHLADYLAGETRFHTSTYPNKDSLDNGIIEAARRVTKLLRFGSDFEKTRDEMISEADRMKQSIKEVEIQIDKFKKQKKQNCTLSVAYAENQIQIIELELERHKMERALWDCESELSSERHSRERKYWDKRRLHRVYAKNRRVPTTFRPLGRKVTARLLWHGYFLTMMNTSVLLDYELIEPVPDLSTFEKLADGKVR